MNAPHLTRPVRVPVLMLKVWLALLPGIAAQTWLMGIGVPTQILIATVSALGFEAAMLALRGQPIKVNLLDGSAVLSAALLALALPPALPWWLTVIGSFFAMVVAKQLFGGLGNNLFNPAMVGFATLLVCFPAQMAQWPAQAPEVQATWQAIFGLSPFDAIASATPLDHFRTLSRQGLPFDATTDPRFAWVALAYLLGGLYLLAIRLVPWQLPLAFLGGLAASAALGQLVGQTASPLFHLAAGSTMLGAFFIVTDPVTAPSTPRGRLIFAALAGVLTWVIRSFGNYPDGVAFAVLIMNITVPLLDQLTRPAAFGHKGRP
ncbi:RnfABCDGE type electron transport complex subunit D [Chitinimonas lacunae]|uniref:Ion-translocating oxidoreductase complex subunit D n=1 Tax=Chitinimonas lacunae TaxID=1963018 RepID=A0ABV8MUP2_9NEIS